MSTESEHRARASMGIAGFGVWALAISACVGQTSQPVALRSFGACVVVEVSTNAAASGRNLLAACEAAGVGGPAVAARTSGERTAVLVPPGTYDMGSNQLVLARDRVDLVGLSSVPEHQHIVGRSAGMNSGVIRQTADDVRLENLFVECTLSDGLVQYNPSDSAAYFPDSGLTNTVVRNCRFKGDDRNAWSMRIGIDYAGTYEDSRGGAYSFGGYYGKASGAFKRCSGLNACFGGAVGIACGRFVDCTGGDYSFAGHYGVASGVFDHCRMAGWPWGGVLSGKLEGCQWQDGVTVTNGAAIYDSTIRGSVTGVGAGVCRIAHVRCRALDLGAVTNLIQNAANVADTHIE